jgi:hypothetical protein
MPLPRPFGNPLRRFTEGLGTILERREHDAAMQDPDIAAEHAFADTRATSSGEPGCRYCH